MTAARTPDLFSLLDQADMMPQRPKGMRLGWRNTKPDLRSRDGFRWAFPGEWTYTPDDGRDTSRNHPDKACPSDTLGGLCLAKTWQGARSGGITSAVCLVVAYQQRAVLGGDGHKLRVFGALTLDVIDVTALVRGAYLDGAYLDGANLDGAYLDGANLRGANLDGANLDGASLDRANLDGANLRGANLAGANLRGANLAGANLAGANLTGANLRGANLRGANLDEANLRGANLAGARNPVLPSGWRLVDEIVRPA